MKTARLRIAKSGALIRQERWRWSGFGKGSLIPFNRWWRRRGPLVSMNPSCRAQHPSASFANRPFSVTESQHLSSTDSGNRRVVSEELIEMVVYRFRFLTFLGIWGSLLGSFLCFVKGCTYVVDSFAQYFLRSGKSEKVILTLVEAIDVYLMGTVMLVFGMGLYELFISNLDIARAHQQSLGNQTSSCSSSNLFGLFTLLERPRWLEIQSVNELKTKLGHVIVMVLLVGLLEKSKIVAITSTADLLCFSASILLSSGCLFLLSKLAP